MWCNRAESDTCTHLLRMYKCENCMFVFLSVGLLWKLKNTNLFKRALLWYINSHGEKKSLLYLTECGVFLPKGKQRFLCKISCDVSWDDDVVGLTVNLPAAVFRETAVKQTWMGRSALFYFHYVGSVSWNKHTPCEDWGLTLVLLINCRIVCKWFSARLEVKPLRPQYTDPSSSSVFLNTNV